MIAMYEFRELTKDDMRQQQELMRYAFEPTKNNYEDIKLEEYEKYYRPVTFFGIFDGAILASTLLIIDFRQRVRGVSFPMAGIAGVATKPEYRRKGLVRKLFTETFTYCKEKNFPISSLYPFKFSYYEQFGYAWVDTLTMITGWTDAIKKQNENGYRVEEEKDMKKAIDRMRPLYHQFFSRTNGLIDRDHTFYAFTKRLEKGYYFFSVDEKGNDTGYLVTWFVEKDTIGIREFIAPDVLTRQNLWNFIQLHAGHREKFKIPTYLPASLQIYPYVKEPRLDKVEILANSMLRIINVEDTLSKITYPTIVESVVFKIQDESFDWNNNSYQLSINNGEGAVKKVDNYSAKFNLDIKGLAQLLAGFRNTSELVEQQWLEGDKEEYSKLDNIFPKDYFIVRDFF